MKRPPIFLRHDNQQLTHDQLNAYAIEWRKLKSSSHGLHYIHAEPRFDAVKQIAVCWKTGVPFAVIPARATSSEIDTMLGRLEGYVNIPHGTEDIDLFAVLFTSGTSAEPKIVPLSRGNILAASHAASSNFSMESHEFWIHTLPLNHIGGISIVTRALIGVHGIHLLDKLDYGDLARTISSCHDVVGASLVPTQLRKLITLSDLSVHPQFKGILLGGGPVNPSDIETCKRLRLPVTPSFGMTETAAQCLATPLNTWDLAPAGTCGLPLPGVEIQLRADQQDAGSSLLWVRGKQVFSGYGNTDKTDAFDQHGWFCTGDFATQDEDGYYFIQMRRSDRIVTGGENVNPIEIEQHIEALNLLNGDFAVIGLPDPDWGQSVTLVTTDTTLPSIEFIREALRKSLVAYKLPKTSHIVQKLPRTAAGKIKRHELVKYVSDLNQ
jgi:O-succinylbenzoic acid--CoA ligase